MTLYQFGKRVLNRLGLLETAADWKRRWPAVCHNLRYRLLLVSRSKTGYLRYFDASYRNRLAGGLQVFGVDVDRYKSFRLIFETLLRRKSRDFTIIETGCSFTGGFCHGNSSMLFFEFLNIFGGKLISIDLDPRHMEACTRIVSAVRPATGRATFFPRVGDSLAILKSLPNAADFVYLDSWDLERDDPEPSMRHHLAELKAAKDIFRRSGELLLAVDDNLKPLGIGKGKYVREWAEANQRDILMDDYQLVIRLAPDSADLL